MNSKEALNSIADKCAIKEYDKDGNLIKWVGTIDKEYLAIMKDLEVLDIMKSAIIECDLFVFYDDFYDNEHHHYIENMDNSKSMFLTKEQYNLLKEWLDA